jgi:hypothetical protein
MEDFRFTDLACFGVHPNYLQLEVPRRVNTLLAVERHRQSLRALGMR